MTNEPSSDEVQRWTAKRKAAVVLDLIAGKTTSAEVARSHGLTVSEIEQWKSDFITQGTESLGRKKGQPFNIDISRIRFRAFATLRTSLAIALLASTASRQCQH